MTYKELIDYCNMNCIDCPYHYKECLQFLKEIYCLPWIFTNNDEELLSREVGENGS